MYAVIFSYGDVTTLEEKQVFFWSLCVLKPSFSSVTHVQLFHYIGRFPSLSVWFQLRMIPQHPKYRFHARRRLSKPAYTAITIWIYRFLCRGSELVIDTSHRSFIHQQKELLVFGCNKLFYTLSLLFFLFHLITDGWTTDDLVFLWRTGDPVQVTKNLQLPRFALEKFKTDNCNSKTNTGRSGCKFHDCSTSPVVLLISSMQLLILIMCSPFRIKFHLPLSYRDTCPSDNHAVNFHHEWKQLRGTQMRRYSWLFHL